MKVYYKSDDNNSFVVYDSKKGEYKEVQRRPRIGYEMLKSFGCDATEEGLKDYCVRLKEASDELETYLKSRRDLKDCVKEKNENGFVSLKFVHPNGNNSSLMRRLFSYLCSVNSEDYEHISYEEHTILSRLHGGGLIAGVPYEGIGYGYDINEFYGGLLGQSKRQHKFKFPVRKGTIRTLESMPTDNKKIPYGAYHVCIESTHPKIKFILGLKKGNQAVKQWFSHFEVHYVNYLIKAHPELNLSMKIRLDGKPNALTYDESDLVESTSIFEDYFNVVNGAKYRLKGNPLSKLLMNSIYGYQKIKYNPIKIKESKFDKYSDTERNKYIVDFSKQYINKKGENVYYMIRRDRIYEYPLARLSFFLPCKGRVYMGKKIFKILDDVVRVHTDGFITSKKHDELISKRNFFTSKEDKYYGKEMKIKHALNIQVKTKNGKFNKYTETQELLI